MVAKSHLLVRLIAHERGLVAGAIIAAAIAVALGAPIEFVLFALTLVGVGLFHHHTLQVALTGLAAIVLYKLAFTGFRTGPGLGGLALHLAHEWVILANLLGLLLGFALLSKHFEESKVPAVLPHFLPDDWKGGFVLLVLVFVLSSFLDNIAAALIGGTMAGVVFRHKVHVGFLAAIVAASNAGGSGSVVGDTTTTMMWIDGVNPLDVLHAYAAAAVAVVVFGVPAAMQQQRYSPIIKESRVKGRIDWARVGIVAFILVAAILANIATNVYLPGLGERFPVLGATVWGSILLATPLRKPAWGLLPEALKGSIFLLSLVICASLMPVEKLPAASWQTALGLGFVSAVFDNIPLTALALKQGGYDWGVLAYTVGFGGSMIWFGSSAGVALSNMYPEAKSVGRWLREGWHVVLAYVLGFIVMLSTVGWEPHAPHKTQPGTPAPGAAVAPVVAFVTTPAEELAELATREPFAEIVDPRGNRVQEVSARRCDTILTTSAHHAGLAPACQTGPARPEARFTTMTAIH